MRAAACHLESVDQHAFPAGEATRDELRAVGHRTAPAWPQEHWLTARSNLTPVAVVATQRRLVAAATAESFWSRSGR